MLYITIAGYRLDEVNKVRNIIEPILKRAELDCVITEIETREKPSEKIT